MSEPSSLQDVIAAKDAGHVPFYLDHGVSHPRAVSGVFRRIKWVLAALLLATWHLAPFLRWNRGPGAPDQAILIDMVGRRAYFFFIEIWPQEVYYLTGLLLIAGLALFTMSAMAGRIWCGFLCWQTVYTDVFVAVERWIIGDRSKVIEMGHAQWSFGKFGRLAAVNALWAAIGLACGLSFALYFGDAFQMLRDIFTGHATVANYGAIAVVGGFCFLLAGYAREHVCVYMCPYGRFQSAMFDEHSLIVSYEAWRGEPRAPIRKSESFDGRGHCVDCRMCVVCCPTGTDIRFGNQLSCIGCGLCIDACDAVMKRHNLPTGLISYDSAYNISARGRGEISPRRLIRPRTIIYMSLVALALLGMLTSLLLRSHMDVDVLHERSPLYVALADGGIRNGYTVKILNMDRAAHAYALSVNGIADAKISVIGGDPAKLAAPADDVATYRLYVSSTSDVKRSDIDFVITRDDGHVVRKHSFFTGPN